MIEAINTNFSLYPSTDNLIENYNKEFDIKC